MSANTAELAALVDAAARSVPGVTELYYARPLPARLVASALARTECFSTVTRADGSVSQATVSIGIAQGRADQVARAVAARVRVVLGDPTAHVTVRVSRITVP